MQRAKLTRGMKNILNQQNCCSGKYYLFTLCRTSTEGERKMVVTSSKEAYGVVSVGEGNEYDVHCKKEVVVLTSVCGHLSCIT